MVVRVVVVGGVLGLTEADEERKRKFCVRIEGFLKDGGVT